jgi:RND family efflux transporter MFP subunit
MNSPLVVPFVPRRPSPLRETVGRRQILHLVLATTALAAAVACGKTDAPAGGAPPGGQMPAMPVEMTTLAPKPIEQIGEFVATVKSRRQTTVQPQVDGIVTKIDVKSGDRVAPGATILQIDPSSQEAAVSALQGQKAARQADATYAHQAADRAKNLLDVGAGSKQDYEQALAAQQGADAQLKTIDDQIRQAQTQLNYYRVTAPTSGIIGDIPVRQGDRVTTSTMITTIDDNAGLEIYIDVPVQQSPQLKLGLPVRVVDDAGNVLATEAITFISPSVGNDTQTILVKAAIAGGPGQFRTDQFVRVQIVWSTTPGLTVPVVAVNRINGQFFVFVAVPGQKGGLAAHQIPVTLGRVIGNEYVVIGGLKAGDKLITGGLQKIGDGAPVQEMPSRGAGAGAQGQGGQGDAGRGGGSQ